MYGMYARTELGYVSDLDDNLNGRELCGYAQITDIVQAVAHVEHFLKWLNYTSTFVGILTTAFFLS